MDDGAPATTPSTRALILCGRPVCQGPIWFASSARAGPTLRSRTTAGELSVEALGDGGRRSGWRPCRLRRLGAWPEQHPSPQRRYRRRPPPRRVRCPIHGRHRTFSAACFAGTTDLGGTSEGGSSDQSPRATSSETSTERLGLMFTTPAGTWPAGSDTVPPLSGGVRDAQDGHHRAPGGPGPGDLAGPHRRPGSSRGDHGDHPR